MKKVLIASDHAGLHGKEAIKKTLEEMGVEDEDLGATAPETVDQIIRAFLTTGFDGGRHLPRLEKIAILEQKKD
ncbi:MAG: hypothetical protein ACREBD_14615 [Blastocatellia bacterium]